MALREYLLGPTRGETSARDNRLGGSGGTAIITTPTMRALPIGMPKRWSRHWRAEMSRRMSEAATW